MRQAGLVAAMVLVLAGCAPEAPPWQRLSPSVKAPPFILNKLDGGMLSLDELKGRIVLMEFWATWCEPCRYSSPSLDAIHRQYRDRGVTVLLVNQGEPAQKVRQWAGGRFQAQILLDGDLSMGRRYSVEGVPMLFIIDGDGQIQYVQSGYGGGLEQDLHAVLNILLAEREAKPHAG